MSAKKIFEKLIGIAHGYSWRLSGQLRAKSHGHGKPGELLERLSDEEREELKKLTSEDVKDAQRDTLNYMLGTYPESTVTIHTHTKKSNEED